MSLDGHVEKICFVKARVYDLAHTDGSRGRAEASIVGIELHPDPDGVIVKIGQKQYLVPDQVLDAVGNLA